MKKFLALVAFIALAVSCESDDTGVAKKVDTISQGTEYEVTVTHQGNGSAMALAGSNIVSEMEHGKLFRLLAIPADGYQFTGWEVVSGGIVLSGADETSTEVYITMPGNNVSVNANFTVLPTYEISTSATNGSVVVKIGGAVQASPVKAWAGATVTITAVADDEFENAFSQWVLTDASAASTTAIETTFIMPAKAVSVEAQFVATTKHDIAITVDGTGGNFTIKRGTDDITAAPQLAAGAIATIEAVPATGYEFVQWFAPITSHVALANNISAKTTFTMAANDVAINVYFKMTDYTVSVSRTGTEGVDATADGESAGLIVHYGDTITLKAIASNTDQFSQWTIKDLEGNDITSTVSFDRTAADVTFSMPASSLAIEAEFVAL